MHFSGYISSFLGIEKTKSGLFIYSFPEPSDEAVQHVAREVKIENFSLVRLPTITKWMENEHFHEENHWDSRENKTLPFVFQCPHCGICIPAFSMRNLYSSVLNVEFVFQRSQCGICILVFLFRGLCIGVISHRYQRMKGTKDLMLKILLNQIKKNFLIKLN